MKPVPHGEPYAGKLHVRFDEGYPQSRRRVAKRCTSRGAGAPDEGRSALLYLGTDRRLSLAQNPVVRGNVARPLAAVEMRLWIAANEG